MAARTRAPYAITHDSAPAHATPAGQAPHRLPTAAVTAGRTNGR
ncbi:hypothetical protein ACFWVP_04455 [Streptomyces sp. NPDC058637]